jgi:metallopeptidase MepB
MREDVFKLVDAAFQTRESQNLDPERLHVLEKVRKGYVRNGLELPAGPKRDRFKEIQKRLSQLCIQCQKNLNEEKGVIWFTPEELDGVPSDDIDIDQLEKGTGENEGKVKLTFKYNHYFPTMKYAKNEETRRRYVIAEANKVSSSSGHMFFVDFSNTSSVKHQHSTFPGDPRTAGRGRSPPRFP